MALSYFFGEQAWHPALAQGSRKGKTQWRARAIGFQHAATHQCRNNAARLAFARTYDGVGIATRQFAAIEDGFKNGGVSVQKLLFGQSHEALLLAVRGIAPAEGDVANH